MVCMSPPRLGLCCLRGQGRGAVVAQTREKRLGMPSPTAGEGGLDVEPKPRIDEDGVGLTGLEELRP